MTASDEVRNLVTHARQLLEPVERAKSISDWKLAWLNLTLATHTLETALVIVRKQIP